MKRMNPEAWEKLRKENPGEWWRLYMDFINNPKNSHRCEECPENMEFERQWNRSPCGQYHCWVDIHNRKE